MPIINSISIENSAWWLVFKDGIDQKRWPEVTKACGAVAATFYHQNQLRRRFLGGNHSRFALARRNEKYLAEKRALARRGKALLGGVVDLVKSGDLATRLQAFGSVSSTAKQAVLTMVGPWYTRVSRLRNDGTPAPDKALEITLLIEEERQEIARQQQETMVERMTADYTTERITL